VDIFLLDFGAAFTGFENISLGVLFFADFPRTGALGFIGV
jgi:hypothetical protein